MDDVARRYGRSLPHWTRPNGTYFLTFRTADSLPQETVLRLREDFESDLRILCRELGRAPTHEELLPLKTERHRRANGISTKATASAISAIRASPSSPPTPFGSSRATATTSTLGA